MDRHLLKKLVTASYNKDASALDSKTVDEIASHLSRKELKAYIKALKAEIAKQTIYVESAQLLTDADKKGIADQFSGKKIVATVNPDLLAGLTVTDNDIIYELNLQSSLRNISAYLSESV